MLASHSVVVIVALGGQLEWSAVALPTSALPQHKTFPHEHTHLRTHATDHGEKEGLSKGQSLEDVK